MEPEHLTALEQFKKEVSALVGDALLDRWIAQEYQPKLTELEVQRELHLEVALAANFGLMNWRKAAQARKKTTRNADRT
jgi:hypothetical protein